MRRRRHCLNYIEDYEPLVGPNVVERVRVSHPTTLTFARPRRG